MRSRSSSIDRTSSGLVSSSRSTHGGATGSFQYKKGDSKAQFSSPANHRKDASLSGLNTQPMSQSGLAVVRKKRVHAQVSIFNLLWILSHKFTITVAHSSAYVAFGVVYGRNGKGPSLGRGSPAWLIKICHIISL